MAEPGILTDGTGVSSFTVPKIIKDFIADALLAAGAALATANIVGIPTDKTTATVAGLAIAGAIIHAAYRAILKWTSS